MGDRHCYPADCSAENEFREDDLLRLLKKGPINAAVLDRVELAAAERLINRGAVRRVKKSAAHVLLGIDHLELTSKGFAP